jgi:tRNA G46 methylase TrmB
MIAASHHFLDELRHRLKVRGDAFLDSDGEKLFAELKMIAQHDLDATKAAKEIEHRRSEKIE